MLCAAGEHCGLIVITFIEIGGGKRLVPCMYTGAREAEASVAACGAAGRGPGNAGGVPNSPPDRGQRSSSPQRISPAAAARPVCPCHQAAYCGCGNVKVVSRAPHVRMPLRPHGSGQNVVHVIVGNKLLLPCVPLRILLDCGSLLGSLVVALQGILNIVGKSLVAARKSCHVGSLILVRMMQVEDKPVCSPQHAGCR